MAKRDYYEVLGVDKNADAKTLKKAYRKVAMKYHPDKNPDDKAAEEKFKEAAEAYEVLNNPDKKARYDQYGHAGMGGAAGGGFGGGGFGNMEDIFSQFGDIFGGGGGFGGSSRGGRRVRKGSNLRIKVKLNLKEVAEGVTKKIKVNKYVSCKPCSGSGAKDGATENCGTCNGQGQVTQVVNSPFGRMQTQATCPTCRGEGQQIKNKCGTCYGDGIVKEPEQLEINIPAGVAEGMQLSVAGKGNAAARGGVNGDLLVVIEEEEHAELKRDGNNVIYNLFVNFADLALGTSAEIPTVTGKAKIKLAEGTQSGKILRLRGKGLPDVNGYGKGDLLVQVNVWTPQELNKEEKALLEKLKVSENFKPNPTDKDRNFFEKMKEFFH